MSEVAFVITPEIYTTALRTTEREPMPRFWTFSNSNNHLVVRVWKSHVAEIRAKLGNPFFRISRIEVMTDRTSRASYSKDHYRRRLNLRITGDAP